ncbi:MAG: helix-hairpin-helix domain-containing protein [Rhodocyclales bacterium]|nr:helix-hairpin-helix domain-containing protein [Rhodocyclales bacterium]
MSFYDAPKMSNANIRFGNTAAYRLTGDLVQMDAELCNIPPYGAEDAQLSLQLWANAADHTAIKLAESPLQALWPDNAGFASISLQTAALPPAGHESYQIAMQLVAQTYDGSQVLDQVSFQNQQIFVQPQIEGEVSSQRAGDTLTVTVERVTNPRSDDNQSGTLALEIWALPENYRGGAFAGTQLAHQELAPLAGQNSCDKLQIQLQDAALAANEQQLVLMLREWTNLGYLTRDYRALLIAEAPAQASAEVAVEVAEQAAPAVAEAEAEVVAEERAPVVAEVAATVEIAPASQSTAKTPASPADKHDDKLVSINHASAAELAKVKGLNQRLAESIIAGRPWAKLEALVAVKGIGEKTLARLRKHLQL